MKNIAYLLLAIAFFSCKNETKKEQEAKEVTVYTHRHYESDQMLFKKFEDKTGIKVNVVNANADELIQKMTMEGAQSPADVLITVDAGRLHRAKMNDLLQPVESDILKKAVPSHLSDSDNMWFGISKRARIIAYAKDRVSKEELSTYEDLASEKWKNRIVVRSSSNVYNQSLMAAIIANNGEEAAKEWAAGVVSNLVREPKGNDRDQVKAIFAGEGDITIVNSYYIGNMLNSSNAEEVKAAQGIGVFFPNQETTGTHVNVSGIGVAKYAPNKSNAIAFIEFLVSDEAQEIFANSNYEYPISKNVSVSETLQQWGDFKEDQLNLSILGENNKKAVILFDEARWK
ncbi:MAG TPA: Fe(3+) ABC transporter substrate-binding protein [Flavobacteriaceae bacterium]|nr:Fe(3+) ABC transporter substrate-binding protein [Flavobacteriaceae bacterium]